MFRKLFRKLCSGLVIATLAQGLVAQEREYINPVSAADQDGLPFSGAVRVGDTLYLSGMLGLRNGAPPEDPVEEARLLLDTVKATLEQAQMTMDDLVYVQIFCSDLTLYNDFNAVYRSYFTREFPARAFVGAGPLVFNARFEIQSIAVKRQ